MEARYAMLFALLLAVPAVSAVPLGFGNEKDAALDAALADVICRNDFTISQMESLMSQFVGYESLQDNIDALDSDEDALSDYASEGDAQGFREYVRDTYSDNSHDARMAYMDARKEVWRELSGEEKKGMRDEYRSLLDDFHACHLDAMKAFAEAKVDAYKHALDIAQDKADNLSAKGVDTSELDDLIDEAGDEVVTGLENEVQNAGDSSQLREGIGKYCLFNGCPNGNNYHFAARFEVKKLGAVLDALEDDAEEAGLGSEVAAARGYLEDAGDSLHDIGSNQYQESEGEAVWDDIRNASEAIRDILGELRSG